MKIRLAFLIFVIALLLMGNVWSGQSGGPAPYAFAPGTASGGRYHLTSLEWQVSGAASGEGYQLLSPAAPASSENGCCCIYLPCILRGD